MTTPQLSAKQQARLQSAFSSLQTGRDQEARASFEELIAEIGLDATGWLAYAHCCFRLEDPDAAINALDRSLDLEPNNLRALLLKADCLEESGESRQAMEYYQACLGLTSGISELPPDVEQGLARARQAVERKNREYRRFLDEKMRQDSIDAEFRRSRFSQSLDLMLGEKEIYYQEPRRYYYPGLPQIQFYEAEDFDWSAPLMAATDVIREELLAVMNDPGNFAPYLQGDSNHLGQYDPGLLNNRDWGALYLWEHGHLLPQSQQRFPATLEALAQVPMPVIPAQAPMALFSRLAPRTRIPPHNGVLNTRLICHLPLIVPENCGALRVGNEQRPWKEGELLIFDDSIQHEAWNDSDEERVVLLFEVWRPELDDEERRLVSWLLAAVKEYYGE